MDFFKPGIDRARIEVGRVHIIGSFDIIDEIHVLKYWIQCCGHFGPPRVKDLDSGERQHNNPGGF